MRAALSERKSDAELVEASRSGSREAFRDLVLRYQSAVRSMAFALSGSSSESEEVAQEAFVAAWCQLADLRHAQSFRHWIYAIVRNLVRRTQRTEHYEYAARSETLAPGPTAQPSALERMINREEELAVWRALSTLPESYRLALVLFYREQQSVGEVARALDVSENSIKIRLSRGRKQLSSQVASLLQSSGMVANRSGPGLAAAVLTAISSIPSRRAAAASVELRPRSPAENETLRAGKAASLLVTVLVGGGLYLGVGALQPKLDTGALNAAVLGPRPPVWSASLVPPGDTATFQRAQPRLERAATAHTRKRTILDFDFEDGLLPEGFSQGYVLGCPGPPASRYCLIGTVHPKRPTGKNNITFGLISPTPAIIFTYSSRMVLSFDYWIGSDEILGISLELHNNQKADKYLYHIASETLSHEVWTHVDVPLAAFESSGGPTWPSLEEGESFRYLNLSGGSVGGKPFYVDNLRVTDGAP